MTLLSLTASLFYCDNSLTFLHIVAFVVDEEEWLDFLELTLADWLEQVEGAAEKVTIQNNSTVFKTQCVCEQFIRILISF